MARWSELFINNNYDGSNDTDLCFKLLRQIVPLSVVLNIAGAQELPQSSRFPPAVSEAAETSDRYFDSVLSCEG